MLEAHDGFCSSDDVYVSLNAISGAEHTKVIKLRSLIQNQVLLQLFDTGSSHTFLSERMLDRIQCNVVQIQPIKVKVANGQTIFCTQVVKNLSWWIQENTFTVDSLVLPLGAYDMVLGMDWLQQFRTMNCDWLEKWVEFQYQGDLIRLQGVVPPPTPQLQEISAEQLTKWCKGNEVWAFALLEPVSSHVPSEDNGMAAVIKQLLIQHEDVFQDTKTLPPSKVYDHHISLIPGSTPVNSRPYRYSPL
uniref:Uncharacterized protein n=1 Tax=Arundo donax TaxID=35708 RepID=A0A0A8YL06_ARUDO